MDGREGLASLGQQLLREATGLVSSVQVPERKVPAHPTAQAPRDTQGHLK